MENYYKLEPCDKYSSIKLTIAAISYGFNQGYKQLLASFLFLSYMVVDLYLIQHSTQPHAYTHSLIIKYVAQIFAYFYFILYLLSGFKKLCIRDSIPYGLKEVVPESKVKKNIYKKNTKVSKYDLMIKKVSLSQNCKKKKILESDFITEFTNLPQIVLNCTKPTSKQRNYFGFIDNEKYKRLCCIRYMAYYSSAHDLDNYISAVSTLFEGLLNRSVIKQGLKLDEDPKAKKNQFISFIYENKHLFNIEDIHFISSSILGLIDLSQNKLNFYINLIFLFFLQTPLLLNKLYDEQKILIKKYGYRVDMKIIDEMLILDYAINESLRAALPSFHMPRYVSTPFVLSNGVSISKGSYVGFNAYSYLRKNHDITEKKKTESKPFTNTELHNNKICSESLIWSVGPRMCIAREFSIYFLKMVLAIILRKYSIEPLYSVNESGNDLPHSIPTAKGAIFTQRYTDARL
ncbi:hypothetical protein BB561_005466 [Smittium simulii]|uniref:Cytochrome P450 n=1 Tax=Smittium simulii TaxID=133385 RepID=A0A2T9YAC0_9FUNG|nr:hypothetical protein BB561_005466 [Smittium simulii]